MTPWPFATNWRNRRAAIVKLLGFVVASVVLTIAGLLLLALFTRQWVGADHASLSADLAVQMVVFLLSAAAPTAIFATATGEKADRFGWGRTPRVRQLAVGAMAGLLSLTLVIVVLALLGAAHFSTSPDSPRMLIETGCGYGVIFVLVGLAEEVLFRGYPLFQLARIVSFWPAAIVIDLVFVAAHIGQGGETAMGLAGIGVFGLLMAFSVWKTKGLWFAVGFHALWDFTETFVYGAPDSGHVSAGSLIVTTFSGPAWLTGASVKPEGSLLALPALGLVAGLIHFGFDGREDRRASSRSEPL